MAAAIVAGKRAALVAKPMEKLLLNPSRALEASAQSVVRSFNTNARTRWGDETEMDRWRRRLKDEHSPFAGMFSMAGWNEKETPDALHLLIDMPGLGKEHVKVSMEQNMLIIKGENENSESRYSSRIGLPERLYNTYGIRAEMTNGVLKVVVPKVIELKDVVKVDVK